MLAILLLLLLLLLVWWSGRGANNEPLPALLPLLLPAFVLFCRSLRANRGG